MTKNEALTEIFSVEDIFNRLDGSKYKITANSLLSCISKKEYSLEELGVSSTTVTRTLKAIWPGKPVGNIRLCSWLLNKYELKFCQNCGNVKELAEFHKNSAKGFGYNTHCKACCIDTRREYQRFYQKTYRETKDNRTPPWANVAKIKEIYSKCPEGFHVDHILPLRGELVSGLHVENNLQYLPALENIKKNNKFDV